MSISGLDKSWAMIGFASGVFITMGANVMSKLPVARRPWIHASWGLVVAYACGSIPRTENYLLELHERTFRAWDRRKLKSETLNARFQARLAEAETAMANDPTLLAHKNGHHEEHVLKNYSRY